MKPPEVKLLIADDHPVFRRGLRQVIEENPRFRVVGEASDGEAALDYLFRRGDYIDPLDSPRPHVILLDLRLPKVGGLEVLKIIKSSAELQTIPVIILTTSAAEADVSGAYEYHANSYLVKPVDFSKFSQLMEEFGFYWLGWNYYPWSEHGKA